MPLDQSILFNELVNNQKSAQQGLVCLNITNFTSKIDNAALPAPDASGTKLYDQLSDLLRETNDAQFGIVSKLNNKGEWVRDATQSKDLADRIPHAHPIIESNNALLRCLSRLKAVDYAIAKENHHNSQELRTKN